MRPIRCRLMIDRCNASREDISGYESTISLAATTSSPVDRQHLIHDAVKDIESRLDGFATSDGSVAMKNLLVHLGTGHQSDLTGDLPFEGTLRVHPHPVVRSDQVHRDIGVDEDHGTGRSS